jgi:hypothetical protein
MNVNEYVRTSDALFHYTRISTAIKHILFTRKIKLSYLKEMNDPKEYGG